MPLGRMFCALMHDMQATKTDGMNYEVLADRVRSFKQMEYRR